MAKRNNTPTTSSEDVDSNWPEPREHEPFRPKKEPWSSRAKYHKHALWILALYIPLVVIPWVLTCIIAIRPLGQSTYLKQSGFSSRELKRIRGWVTAINVFNSIASLVTIPVLGAIIAQAAAVYAQNRNAKGGFQMDYLFALADRGWTNPAIILRSMSWKARGARSYKLFLSLAALLVLIGVLQQPLYQVLVTLETFSVPMCEELNWMRALMTDKHDKCEMPDYGARYPQDLGVDLEPGLMAWLPYNDYVEKLRNELSAFSLSDDQPHLWYDDAELITLLFPLWQTEINPFVAAPNHGATTGVLRQHVMRLNTTVSCQLIDRGSYPSKCGGTAPLDLNFSHNAYFDWDHMNETARTRVCAPGLMSSSPWNLSRDPQHIFEELYLDVLQDDATVTWAVNYTMYCNASTTRGYFEVGNYQNNETWSEILSEWPAPEEMTTDFNDALATDMEKYIIPTVQDPLYGDWQLTYRADIDEYSNPSASWNVSGPLAMTAVSLFGNDSFFEFSELAYNTSIDSGTDWPYPQLCNVLPFSGLHGYNYGAKFPDCAVDADQKPTYGAIRRTFNDWLYAFNDTGSAQTALTAGTFLANQAVLTFPVWYRESDLLHSAASGSRPIRSGKGESIQRPRLTKIAIAAISALIATQVLGLVLLTWFIYTTPTHTRTLDAMTVTNIVAGMEADSKHCS